MEFRGAREVDRGGALRFNHLFACFSDRSMPLIILALVMLAGWFVIWLVTVGVLVGIVEQMAGYYLPTGFQEVTSNIVLLAVLILRPQGLFGQVIRKRV